MKDIIFNSGVTILEMLLSILIISAMIIGVLSYYNLDINNYAVINVMKNIDRIITDEDLYTNGLSNKYAGVASSIIQPEYLNTMWGTSSILVNPISTTQYSIVLPKTPISVCKKIITTLKNIPRITVSNTCAAVEDLTITINSSSYVV